MIHKLHYLWGIGSRKNYLLAKTITNIFYNDYFDISGIWLGMQGYG